MIFVGRGAFAQKLMGLQVQNNGLNTHLTVFTNVTLGYYNAAKKTTTTAPYLYRMSFFAPVLAQNYYTSNFGFFCKKELQLEKITKIPFKFRLGSVQQCDWLEGKHNAAIR